MELQVFQWAIGIFAIVIIGVIGVFNNRMEKTENKLAVHDVIFERLLSIPAILDKHEARETEDFKKLDERLRELDKKVDMLMISTAVSNSHKDS